MDKAASSSTAPEEGPLYGALHAVVPLPTCPHLEKVEPLPPTGIDPTAVCQAEGCGIGAEPWVCLTCFQVNCGRHVYEHAMIHAVTSEHPMALSLADLSVWCYPCDAYIHNEKCLPHKNDVHLKKFGEPAPI